MAYGLTVLNSSGALVINEDYSNYMVVSNGTTANGSYGWSGIASGDDIVWVRPSSAGGNYLNYTAGAAATLQSSTGSIEWVVTRRNPSAASNTMGLRVKRSDGSISFDSGRAPVCPVMNFRDTDNEQAYANNNVYSTQVNAPFSAGSGRKRFIPFDCFCNFLTWNVVSGAAYYVSTKVTWSDENTFQVAAERRFANSSAAGVVYSKPVGTLMYFFSEFAV